MARTSGRPKSQNPKDERLALRVTADEKHEIQSFMKENNISLLDLIKKGMKSEQNE